MGVGAPIIDRAWGTITCAVEDVVDGVLVGLGERLSILGVRRGCHCYVVSRVPETVVGPEIDGSQWLCVPYTELSEGYAVCVRSTLQETER